MTTHSTVHATDTTFNVYINDKYESMDNLNIANDQLKQCKLNKASITLAYLKDVIAKSFHDSKSFSSLFVDNNYEWKLFSYNETNVMSEIFNDIHLNVEVSKFEMSQNEYIKLRVVFFNKHNMKQSNAISSNKSSTVSSTLVASAYNGTEKPKHFIQVTAVTEDDFTVQLDVDKSSKKNRKFLLKDISRQNIELEKITVKSKQTSGEVVVDFNNDHKNDYSIAVYDENNEQLSATIKVIKPSELNIHTYKPNDVDPSTVIKILDEKNETVYLYWNIPSETFGEIKYKICYDIAHEKEEHMVDVLPYSMPLSLMPIDIQIHTISIFDNEEDDENKIDDEKNNKTKTKVSDGVVVRIGDIIPKIHAMIEYIHNDDAQINIEFDANVEFTKFKQLIVNELKLKDRNGVKIGHIDNDKNVLFIDEVNFDQVLSKESNDNKIMFYVGFDPETPTIKEIINYIKGELQIELSSNRINTFCLETDPEEKHMSNISSRDLSMTVTGINSNCKYKIRVMSINQFGKSAWSEWSETYLPLHRFSIDDLCNEIKQWIYDDINYKKLLHKISETFTENSMTGDFFYNKTPTFAEFWIKAAIKDLVTSETLQIILNCFNKWKDRELDNIRSKSSEQMAQIMCSFPINRLIECMQENKIDGAKFIHILDEKENNIFERTTGWCKNEIEQIKLMLCKHRTMYEKQIVGQINLMKTKYKSSESILNVINEQFDVEILHYNIKHNKSIELFSNKIIDFLQMNKRDKGGELVKNTYDAIAACFTFNEKQIDPIGIQSLYQPRDWVCSNCGNYNFSQQIHGDMNYNLSLCEL
eukprot:411869_1